MKSDDEPREWWNGKLYGLGDKTLKGGRCHKLAPIRAPIQSHDKEDDATTPRDVMTSCDQPRPMQSRDKGKAPDRTRDQPDDPETPIPKGTSVAPLNHSTSDCDKAPIIPRAILQVRFQIPSLIRSTATASIPLTHLTELAPTPSGSKTPSPGVTVREFC
jgi:hypothetical protein